MDARHADTRLQAVVADLAGTEPLTPQHALRAFVAFAREATTYEDGSVELDLVRLQVSTFGDGAPWPGADPRPPAGSLVVELVRVVNVHGEDGEHQEWADVGIRMALPPATIELVDTDAEAESPAGADVDPSDEDPLETFAADVTAALGGSATVPATHTFIGGDVPTTPTKAAMATPAARPLRIHFVGDDHWDEPDYGEGALEDALRARRPAGHDRDARRALAIMLAFCTRPIDPGDATVTRDELLITWSPPFPGTADGDCRLRFERSSALVHPGSRYGWSDPVDFELSFDPSDATRAAGPWTIFRAPAASSPDGRLGEAFDPGAPYVDLGALDEVESRMDAAGFAPLLALRATRIKGPCPS